MSNPLRFAMWIAEQFGGNAKDICNSVVSVQMSDDSYIQLRFVEAYEHAVVYGELEDFSHSYVYGYAAERGCVNDEGHLTNKYGELV